MSKNKISYRENADLQVVVGYLENLLEGLRSGNLYLEHGEQNLRLTPSERVSVEIEGAQKDEKETLSIHLGWKTRTHQVAASEHAFHIGPAAPEKSKGNAASEHVGAEILHEPHDG